MLVNRYQRHPHHDNLHFSRTCIMMCFATVLQYILRAGALSAFVFLTPICASGVRADVIHGTVLRAEQPLKLPELAPDENVHEVLRAWADAHGLEICFWRGMVIAEPATKVDIWERLSAAIQEPFRSLIFRGWDDGTDTSVKGYELVLKAIEVLYKDIQTQEASQTLAKAACWMCGPELLFILEPIAAIQRGQLQCRIIPRSEFELMLPSWERAKDKCGYHLMVSAPARGDIPALRPFMFHGKEHDIVAQWLAERKGIITVAEYRRRILNATAIRDDAFLKGNERLRAEVSIKTAGSISAIVQHIAEQVGIKVSVNAPTDALVHVDVKGVRAGDLLRAIARLAGVVILANGDGTYRIRMPQGCREQFLNALPLPLWAACMMTSVEREVFTNDAIKRFHQVAKHPLIDRLMKSSTSIGELPEEARVALQNAVTLKCARLLTHWLLNLPDHSGRVPLALYESDEYNLFELAAPTVSEIVQGWQYIMLKTKLDGKSALVRKVPKHLPKEVSQR